MKKRKKGTRTKVLMIVNPRSGTTFRPPFSARRIAEIFLDNDMEVGVFFTSPEYNADFLVKEHADIDLEPYYKSTTSRTFKVTEKGA